MTELTLRRQLIALSILLTAIVSTTHSQSLPEAFDLRNAGITSMVTDVKFQSGGTCWTHGTMAAIESNLLVTGTWTASGQSGMPNLSEYHLDWWNGFNASSNYDWPNVAGLPIHEGGDYLVAAAYLSRTIGAVFSQAANDQSEYDKLWYRESPPQGSPDYQIYYARDIEWYTIGDDLENLDAIKQSIITDGAIATCMGYYSGFIYNNIHYQSRDDDQLPNHSIAIVGWDDRKPTQAPHGPGAWLCKNSWGSNWGEDGYFWISYYDKWCCREPQMGAVSFRNVEPVKYDHVYYHDLHGWRDTMADCSEAFNAFYATGRSRLTAVSFYTAQDQVDYEVIIYESFLAGQLSGQLARAAGAIANKGFHTIDLTERTELFVNEDFYVYLNLSVGGHAYDRTSEVPVLLGRQLAPPDEPDLRINQATSFTAGDMGKAGLDDGNMALVVSSSRPGESYYNVNGQWLDLHSYDGSANFCIKALAVETSAEPGDFTGDGIIDGRDISALTRAWLTAEGHEAYRRICDVHQPNQGQIDLMDFAVFAQIWADLYDQRR